VSRLVRSAALAAAVLLAPPARAADGAAPAVPPGAAAPAPGAPAAPAPASPEAQDALRQRLERELPPLEVRAFETPGGVKGKVEAAAAPRPGAEDEEDEEGAPEELEIPLGTELPVSCTIMRERLDPGAAIWRMAEAIRSEMKLLSARPLDVVAVAGSPLVFAELFYQVQSEKGPMAGQLEVAVYAHDAHSLLCHHDEPGYSKTFQRVVTGLAASLESDGADERRGGRFAEILVLRVQGMPMGFYEHVVWDREGGGSVVASYGSQLMPRTPTELVAIDTYSEEGSDAKDLLVGGSYVHLTNGEIDAKTTVTREEDGRTFRYVGEKDGKSLSGKFRTKAGLATDLWFARRFDRRSGYGPKAPVTHEGYSMEADPTAAILVTYRKDAARPRRAELKIGPLTAGGELDEHGLFTTTEMPIGPATLVLERVWSRGTP
jgi:hypothetical protein